PALSLFLVSFVFNYSAHHRHLHSFPTRRSSDLSARRCSMPCRHSMRRSFTTPKPPRNSILRRCAWRCPPVKRCRPSYSAASKNVDRKSTRLNSSHSQISYAVFCLKKKKKNIKKS